MARGLKRGLTRGAKTGDGSERKYIERRASRSGIFEQVSHAGYMIEVLEECTFMISIEHVLVRVSKRELIGRWRLLSVSVLRSLRRTVRC